MAEDVAKIIRERIHADFDGECHLTEAEARRAADEIERLREAASGVIESASGTYKKRNCHLASFKDDSGEKRCIVPFDGFESLRSVADSLKPTSSRLPLTKDSRE